jgi:hypothetical protein
MLSLNLNIAFFLVSDNAVVVICHHVVLGVVVAVVFVTAFVLQFG